MTHGKGILMVVSGPAGSGKTTLIETLIQAHPGKARRAVTSTTRPPRPGEINDVDYHFHSREEFERLLAAGDFLEHNVFNGHYYGTPKQALEADLARGGVVILVIDVNGAKSVRNFFPAAAFVFVIPPTRHELHRRLRGRGTEDLTNLKRRLTIAENEITHIDEYRFLVINDKIPLAIRDLEAIIRSVDCSNLVKGAAEEWNRDGFAGWAERNFF
ncbi:MAG: guanylate kinase [Planctomycetota bacterium]|jgi:guanylate kinase|nr:guanylate kinase [Planctomycetota bacterium]